MAWTRGPTIGRGSSAEVSLATTHTGNLFAVKSTDLSSSTLLQREEYLISQLCSPYIVKCLGSDITCEKNKPVYNLFLEYLPGGTLSDRIRKQGGSLDENVIRFYAHELLLGLNYLHLKGLVHCDIKGQNILIGDDGLKIADFGCAKWIESGEPATSAFSGTPGYMAPEVARGEEQSFPADIWALGCTIIEMATGSNPWPEMKDPASALYRIAFSGDVPESPSWFSDNAKDFLSKCLMRDSKERWTAAQLLQHPFFNSVEENCGEIRELTRKSPTSVMDQGFWDAVDVSDSSRNPTEIASSSDSPAGRIRALVGDASPSNWNLTEEEDWLTVRENEIEECSKVCENSRDMDQDFEDLIDAESVTVLSVDEEGNQTSILMEDSLLDCLNGDSITVPVTHTESMRDFSVFRIIYFENYNDYGYFKTIRFLHLF
ncbi:hypothetical protein Pfo_022927 [Paulownia fortunei]|nr:hypothetical protein Pfo_022927 [Paulownia fortunei]